MLKNNLKILFWFVCLITFISFETLHKYEPYLINQQEFSIKGIQPSPILDSQDHTMGGSLFDYLEMKIHPLLKEKEYKNIWVIGDADRSGGISSYEKNDKLFNWQRPTAEIRGDDLYIKAFPGREYVKHYAALIATYFALQDKEWKHVRYILPDETTAWEAILSSNLKEVPEGDVAIIGYGLEQLIGEEGTSWEGAGAFSWIKKKVGDKTILFIGGRHSYWGDIGGRIVSLLAQKGFKQVIYVGKVGGMSFEAIPNQTLATGNSSFVDGEIIHWENRFDFAKGDPDLIFGEHYTIPSVINETKEWLNHNGKYAFVDNEIGFMAKAALSESIGFSYLHIISDNLHGGYEEDLSNERSIEAKQHRLQLLEKAKALIEKSLMQDERQMEKTIPNYLYKIISIKQWNESQSQNRVLSSSMDLDFIHLAEEEQVPIVIQKFWSNQDHIILKLDPNKLAGRLVYETNPGGVTLYYHLYEGSIPLDAVVQVRTVNL